MVGFIVYSLIRFDNIFTSGGVRWMWCPDSDGERMTVCFASGTSDGGTGLERDFDGASLEKTAHYLILQHRFQHAMECVTVLQV